MIGVLSRLAGPAVGALVARLVVTAAVVPVLARTPLSGLVLPSLPRPRPPLRGGVSSWRPGISGIRRVPWGGLDSADARSQVLRWADWSLPSRPVCQLELLRRLPEEPTGRPPLLFVHGMGHAAWCFEDWMSAAATDGWPAYSVSLRGHGGSSGLHRLNRTTLRDYVHDVMQAITRLPDRPVIVGWATGSLVARYVLERYPARAGVLVCPVPDGPAVSPMLRLLARRPDDVVRMLAGRGLPARRSHFFSAALPDQEVDAHLARLGAESALVQYQLLFHRRPVVPTRIPVLVVASPEDRMVSLGTARAVASRYRAELREVRGGHDVMLDAGRGDAIRAILEWLPGHLTSSRSDSARVEVRGPSQG